MISAHIDGEAALSRARAALAQAEAEHATLELAAEDSAAVAFIGVWGTSYQDVIERLDKAVWQVRHKRHVLAGLERMIPLRDAALAEQEAMRKAEHEAAEAKVAQDAAAAAKALAAADAKADRGFLEVMCTGLTAAEAEQRLAKHQANRTAKREEAARLAAQTYPERISSHVGRMI
jgi:hypothetical protein